MQINMTFLVRVSLNFKDWSVQFFSAPFVFTVREMFLQVISNTETQHILKKLFEG